jgi:hypothetical protein
MPKIKNDLDLSTNLGTLGILGILGTFFIAARQFP